MQHRSPATLSSDADRCCQQAAEDRDGSSILSLAQIRCEPFVSLEALLFMWHSGHGCCWAGILDECTSAVSVDVEEKLCKAMLCRAKSLQSLADRGRRLPSDTAANERGIACITISQRLALTQFHTQELRLGKCRAPSAAAPASLLNNGSC